MNSNHFNTDVTKTYALYSREYAETPLETLRERAEIAYFKPVDEIYPSPLIQDLEEMASLVYGAKETQYCNLAQRVFGQQLSQSKATAKHLGNLLAERWKIYQSHMQELQVEISDLKNRLTFASRPHSVGAPQQAANLEKMLFRLESEQRKERTDFWKDSAELRGKMWETAHEYRATRSRAGLLSQSGASDEWVAGKNGENQEDLPAAQTLSGKGG